MSDPTDDQPKDRRRPRELARRHVLMAAGVVGSFAALDAVQARTAAAADGTEVVWQLDPDWGYPRGPHGKTALRSRASRNAAAHRFARTAADAEAMNLHKCSFAPPVAMTVDAAAFAALWDALSYEWTNPSTGEVVRIFDDRHVGRIAQGRELLSAALAGGAANGSPPASGTSPTTSPSTTAGPAGTGTSGSGKSNPATGSGDGTSPTGPAALALTGATPTTAIAAGVGAVAAGIAALRARRLGPDRSSD